MTRDVTEIRQTLRYCTILGAGQPWPVPDFRL